VTSKVSVDLDSPSPYVEKDSYLHRVKRNLSFSFALRKIASECPDRGDLSIFEIGTGSGFFLASAHQRFPGAKLSGIEYDERLLEVTRKRAPFAHCIQGNAETFDLRPTTFDVVVSFQVIEHLYDPSAMLTRVKWHLKPDGIFIVTTPNLDGLGARMMGTRWHAYRPDHVSLKGVSSWMDLIEGQGFTPLYCGSTFFSGIPALNRFPLGILNWSLLVLLGAARWQRGEAFVGVFRAQS
jgi:SAM-dependent methyltransferase